MARALNLSRSLYSLVELGKRRLDPETTQLILNLHAQMKGSPTHRDRRQIEKEVVQELLEDAEELRQISQYKNKVRVKNQKFGESFPVKAYPVSTLGAGQPENPITGAVLESLSDLTQSRMHHYRRAFKNKLKSELDLVIQQAVENHLREKLNGLI